MNTEMKAHLATALGKTVKLGMVAPKNPPKALRLRNYLVSVSPPPLPIDYSKKAASALLRMYLNNQFGCCVIAGKAHALGVWSSNDDSPIVEATDQEILNAYNQLKAGPGDSGCVMSDVLDYKTKTGIVFGGKIRKLDGYVTVDHTNKTEVLIALYLFGALDIGFNLPADWLNSAAPGAVWDLTNSGIVGGHCVEVVGANDLGVQLSTWGTVVTMTWQAFTVGNYVTEVYAMLSPEWYGTDRVVASNGLDAAKLIADIQAFQNGTIPEWKVEPLPAPPVVPPVVPPSPPAPPPVPTKEVWVGTQKVYTGWGGVKEFPLVLVRKTVPEGILGDLPEGWRLDCEDPRQPVAAFPNITKVMQLFEVAKAVYELLQSSEAHDVEAAVKKLIEDGRAQAWNLIFEDVQNVAEAVSKIAPLVQAIIAKFQKTMGAPVGSLGGFWNWMVAHKEEIIQWVEIIVSVIPKSTSDKSLR